MKGAQSYLEKKVVVGPFQCNCRVIVCPKTGETAVIDPGDEPAKIVHAIESFEWKSEKGEILRPRVKWLFHTHAHLDHIGGTRGLREAATHGSESAKIALHRDDLEIYNNLPQQGMLFGMKYDEPHRPDHFLEHEEEIRVGSLHFTVVHTPGHSPGSLCLRLHEDSAIAVPETLYSGDTLFQGSVGRTDLWGADGEQMFRSIRERILTLDDDTRVCPGHGPETRVAVEKRENPFLR
jgi:glyoxylase-like metal-dependent hydrolase (beta-lactamase superfamily II)